MKIFFIGQKGLPATDGGVENHVENLATELTRLGHDVFAYTRHSYSDKKKKEYKGVNLIPLPSIKTKSLDAISHTFLASIDFIFKRNADVIHFHSIGPASIILLIKIFKPKTKVVFTFHSQCYLNSKWGKFAKTYLKIGEMIGCKFSDKIITVSKTLKKYVEDKYNKDAEYIPNGVKKIEETEAKEIKKIWNLEKDSYLLSISRIVKNKGIDHLVNAYKQIKTDKKLVIVGDGDFLKEAKKISEDNENIIFTGYQKGIILDELLSNTFLFIHPSEAEGLSIALLEAMSANARILSSDIDANLELLGDNAYKFKSKDVNDLKEKIENIIKNIDNNKKYVYDKKLEDFEWKKITQSILTKVY